LFPKFVIAIALGFGVYIMGITTIARNEAVGGPSPDLYRGLLFTMIGAAVLAFAPQTAVGNFNWQISPRGEFPILIGMIAFPVILRGLRLVNEPTAEKIQTLVRVGILTLIPLAAAFAFLGAGPVWGLLVFSLVVPAIMLARQFRVT
jgi:4-hydroxybenzoate polyprenyltransferase